MKKYLLFIVLMLVLTFHTSAKKAFAAQSIQIKKHSTPAIQHGIDYKAVEDINQYYISEKLDGVRGYWDGEKLLSRQGNPINTPIWFTHNWPEFPIDGELWIGRGKFQPLLSCVSKAVIEDSALSCWQHVRFMIFDLPTHQGTFTERVVKMQTLLTQIHSPYFAMISQERLSNIDDLDLKLNEVITMNGEGLMLHLAKAYYQTGRSAALMKLKKHQDAEAIVIGHTKGQGKYEHQLGAIQVEMVNGIRFKIGTGFSDLERANPPQIGSIVTFKYNGLTDAGIPRFARFWRIKSNIQHQVNTKQVISLADK